MPNLPDLKPWLDQVKRELEDTVYFPPEWAVDRLKHSLAEAIANALPKCFTDSLHEVIAKSVEKTLADVLSRSVAEGVERGIKPLLGEFADWRWAMETFLKQLRSDPEDWWKHGPEPDDEDKDGEG